ncbi:arginine--tRNA ligase [Carboxylicivirga sp. N1Y90]|uniref:arginine--tRNA ligase n=1 Tax=Carboxylicivirga fragile TaxID=3417571 RepID=UPI003D35311F|nr:arginine--tRNA ligase [Marinilabiliaceae bacterium N1Y90]
MGIENQLKTSVVKAVKELYGAEIALESIQLQVTRKDMKGDYTIVVFPLLKVSKKNPVETGNELGAFIKNDCQNVSEFDVIKGFLNIQLSHAYWIDFLNKIGNDDSYGIKKVTDESSQVMIEYSSPNTNKPLHLGHIRNNLLGYSLSRIVEANGNKVVKTNIVNDRGIHICKSMLAWKKWGEGQTPESTGKKGDHLVGDYYVRFDQELKKEQAALIADGASKEEAEASSPLMKEAREMLLKWEANDPEVYALWEQLNKWVYSGFATTYETMGVDFDKIYYESDTYKTGRDMVLGGVEKGVFEKREDNSVWADLEKDGLDEKLLLRADGTSVYMTQDIGTAKLRFDDYKIDEMVYVVGNEQNYHFKVLAILLDRLGFDWGKDLVHFSYGMVELPEGKMKSREGTVVDADDLMAAMIDTARDMSKELGKLEGYSEEEAEKVYKTIALGALKYFILKVDPRKNMTFDPKESIDFNGNTGPFIQYTYARIQSIGRKAADKGFSIPDCIDSTTILSDKEVQLMSMLANFPSVVKEAGKVYSPAVIANYIYDMAKEFNQFYHDSPIAVEENEAIRSMRLFLCKSVGQAIKNGMWMLGIDVPERM